MKALNKILAIFIIAILALSVITYIGIIITNNSVAASIKQDLVAYEVPEETELVDSMSKAGKLNGNGNGMQYMGAILVKSALSREEIEDYYSSKFDFIEVRKQDTTVLYFDLGSYSFKGLSETENGSYYSIICWDDNRAEYGDFINGFLDLDLRGH